MKLFGKNKINDSAICRIDISKDNEWNKIPLGKCIGGIESNTLYWLLNNEGSSIKHQIPSTSVLITGGTGNGKSVEQDVIISHISRFSEFMEAHCYDIKGISFNHRKDCKGITKILSDIKDIEQDITEIDKIMMSRFEEMRKHNVNNIYDIKDETVDKKAIIIMIDELREIKTHEDKETVQSIYNSIGSIARLGRAAGIHLCIGAQRATSDIITADLINNIQLKVALGDFDAGISSVLFDDDLSHLAKPEIKGRGLAKSGNSVFEYQCFYPDKDTFEIE